MMNRIKQSPVIITLVFAVILTYSVSAQEQPFQHIIFGDVEAQGANYWARNAIYQMASRSVIKGDANGYFHPFSPVTREEVLAFLYRLLEREAEAQQFVEYYLNRDVFSDPGEIHSKFWWLGYFILAEKDGLITKEELEHSLKTQKMDGQPAQRQEVAVWIAKLLELEPVYSMQVYIDSFSDGMEIDPLKRPYVESVLRNGIMSGSEGHILPKNHVLRDQMAQLLVNIEQYLLSKGSQPVRTMDELLSQMDFDSVYKGTVYFYDPYTEQIIVRYLSKWENNSWYPLTEQTYVELALQHDTLVFSEDKKITLHDINRSLLDCEAYFAVKTDGDGNQQIQCIIVGNTWTKNLAQ